MSPSSKWPPCCLRSAERKKIWQGRRRRGFRLVRQPIYCRLAESARPKGDAAGSSLLRRVLRGERREFPGWGFGSRLHCVHLRLRSRVPCPGLRLRSLPTQLLDTTLTINNVVAPLFYVSPGQINAQVPFETPTGTMPIQVMRADTGAAGAATSSLLVALVSPGIFTAGGPGSSQGAILTSTGEIAGPSGSLPGQAVRPAHHGEFISIFLTGLGDVTNRPASGAPAPIPPPYSEALLTTTLTIGGVTATPVFSGLAPLFVGLYQVNVQVPDAVPTGDAIQVVLSIGGAASNAVTIAIQ